MLKDGLVPSAVLTNNEPIKEKTLEFLNYVLDHQDESGQQSYILVTSTFAELYHRMAWTRGQHHQAQVLVGKVS